MAGTSQDKPGHDACLDSSDGTSDTDAIISSGLPIRTTRLKKPKRAGEAPAQLMAV